MLIFANPTTRPARRRSKSKGPKMATKRKTKRRRVTARRVTVNPAPKRRRRSIRVHSNPVHKRRRVKRNPGMPSFARGILGELASMNGVLLLASAVAAPTITDMAVDAVLPAQYNEGYTRLAAKAVFIGAAAYALDRWAKSRHAALGFAIGGLGNVINDGIKVIRVRQSLPPTVEEPKVADEIARNPAAFESLMAGNWGSLNGYGPVMEGYSPVLEGYNLPHGENGADPSGYDSLN